MKYKITTHCCWFRGGSMIVKMYFINGMPFTFDELPDGHLEDQELIKEADKNSTLELVNFGRALSGKEEFTNFSDEIQTSQIGGSAWGNDLEVSIYVVDKDGVFTLATTNDEIIQIQLECVAYDDQYDFERFK